jgi:hypothetical protein
MKKPYLVKALLLLFVFMLLIAASSCMRYGSVSNLETITINMTKEDVMKKMPKGGVARGAVVNKFGQKIEVREYQLDRGKSGGEVAGEVAITLFTFGLGSPVLFSHGSIETYWLYFYEGRLVQWGRAGDWAETERRIYDINFNMRK